MFSFDDVCEILEYLEEYALSLDIEVKVMEHHLTMLHSVYPDVDHSAEEEEAEYHRKYLVQLNSLITMVRNRYESWKRCFSDDNLPF